MAHTTGGPSGRADEDCGPFSRWREGDPHPIELRALCHVCAHLAVSCPHAARARTLFMYRADYLERIVTRRADKGGKVIAMKRV